MEFFFIDFIKAQKEYYVNKKRILLLYFFLVKGFEIMYINIIIILSGG